MLNRNLLRNEKNNTSNLEYPMSTDDTTITMLLHRTFELSVSPRTTKLHDIRLY